MLEKINQKNAPKEVINALISLYNKGEQKNIKKVLQFNRNIHKFTRNLHNIRAIHYKLTD